MHHPSCPYLTRETLAGGTAVKDGHLATATAARSVLASREHDRRRPRVGGQMLPHFRFPPPIQRAGTGSPAISVQNRPSNGLSLRKHRMGRGVVQDNAQAVAWYRKAAEQGALLMPKTILPRCTRVAVVLRKTRRMLLVGLPRRHSKDTLAQGKPYANFGVGGELLGCGNRDRPCLLYGTANTGGRSHLKHLLEFTFRL